MLHLFITFEWIRSHKRLFLYANSFLWIDGLSDCFIPLFDFYILKYREISYTVKWGEEVSKSFSVSNGIRQGGVSSGVLFVVYIGDLLTLLRKSGLGCRIHGIFFGAVIYADDIFLLSASRSGLQFMIDICQKFTARLNLKFGTNSNPDKSKTKCLIFSESRKAPRSPVREIRLGSHTLPWVSQVKHLGHTMQLDNSMKIDTNLKRGAFIGKVNSLLQEFYFAAPSILMKLMTIYCCNIYGSNVWDLFSAESQRLYRSYNVALRTIFNLPRTTHRYLLESLSDTPHLYTQLLSRYVTFSQSLLRNRSMEIRFLSCVSLQCCVVHWAIGAIGTGPPLLGGPHNL